jgi:hypothetical protein
VEAHAHFLERLRGHVPHLHLARPETSPGRPIRIGLGAGVGGGLMLAAPLVVYDWVKPSHSALELPTAVTGWQFGLDHYAQHGYRWWPIVIGALFLLAYSVLEGLAFAGLADRVYRVHSIAGSLTLGAVWGFVSFMFFWYMLLPIARDGAPVRATTIAPSAFVAPNWVWILAFTLSGLATGACYQALQARTTQPSAATTTPVAA